MAIPIDIARDEYGEIDVACGLCRDNPPNTAELEEMYTIQREIEERYPDPDEREAVREHLSRHLTEATTRFTGA